MLHLTLRDPLWGGTTRIAVALRGAEIEFHEADSRLYLGVLHDWYWHNAM